VFVIRIYGRIKIRDSSKQSLIIENASQLNLASADIIRLSAIREARTLKEKEMALIEWQEKFSTEEACLDYLQKMRWPEGYVCEECRHQQYWYIQGYKIFQCKACRHQPTITAGTILHSTKLKLTKWFVAFYFCSVDKGGISATRLAKYINVSWNTARFMLKKIRTAMGEREKKYLLSGLIELDDAFVGGRTTGGKRGRGSEKKTAILVACENNAQWKKAGFLKMKAVTSVCETSVAEFSKASIQPSQDLRTDGSPTLKTQEGTHRVESQVVPPQETHKWLPWVHIAIANLKRFLLGTYHGVSGKHLQEYLDEFCYRFNRRWCELEIPNRLLKICLNHPPVVRPRFG